MKGIGRGRPKEVLAVGDVARLLGLSVHTVYKLARSGKIPGQMYGRRAGWRFTRAAVLNHVNGVSTPAQTE